MSIYRPHKYCIRKDTHARAFVCDLLMSHASCAQVSEDDAYFEEWVDRQSRDLTKAEDWIRAFCEQHGVGVNEFSWDLLTSQAPVLSESQRRCLGVVEFGLDF